MKTNLSATKESAPRALVVSASIMGGIRILAAALFGCVTQYSNHRNLRR